MSANLAAAGIPTRVWDMMPAAVEADGSQSWLRRGLLRAHRIPRLSQLRCTGNGEPRRGSRGLI